MSSLPDRFWSLAQELGGRTEDEALRTAVGRAYYASYLAARECLRTEINFVIQRGNGGTHEQIWRRFKGEVAERRGGRLHWVPLYERIEDDVKHIHALSKTLKGYRVSADYNVPEFDPDCVDAAMGYAEEILRQVKHIRRVDLERR